VSTTIGNGTSTFFSKDKWIHGCSIEDIAPLITAAVPKKNGEVRTVQQALTSYYWVQDIQGNLFLTAIEQYLQLWEVLETFQLQNSNGKLVWRFSSNGLFSSKSAYRDFYIRAESFEPWKRIWKSWAAPKCKVFVWIAINNKCWTADRLKNRGLGYPENCVLVIKKMKLCSIFYQIAFSQNSFGIIYILQLVSLL
jgi:hypothetical protein